MMIIGLMSQLASCICKKGLMYHVFLLATVMAVTAMAISEYEFLMFLREGRLHKFTKIGLKPVNFYLRSMGLLTFESSNEFIN